MREINPYEKYNKGFIDVILGEYLSSLSGDDDFDDVEKVIGSSFELFFSKVYFPSTLEQEPSAEFKKSFLRRFYWQIPRGRSWAQFYTFLNDFFNTNAYQLLYNLDYVRRLNQFEQLRTTNMLNSADSEGVTENTSVGNVKDASLDITQDTPQDQLKYAFPDFSDFVIEYASLIGEGRRQSDSLQKANGSSADHSDSAQGGYVGEHQLAALNTMSMMVNLQDELFSRAEELFSQVYPSSPPVRDFMGCSRSFYGYL